MLAVSLGSLLWTNEWLWHSGNVKQSEVMPASNASMSCSVSARMCSRRTAIRFAEIFIFDSLQGRVGKKQFPKLFDRGGAPISGRRLEKIFPGRACPGSLRVSSCGSPASKGFARQTGLRGASWGQVMGLGLCGLCRLFRGVCVSVEMPNLLRPARRIGRVPDIQTCES